MDKLDYWKKLEQPPSWAMKKITGGRLSGKTDINPQWRYMAMTELWGPCGIGWKYTIDEVWSVPACEDQVFAFARVSLYVKEGDTWADPIPGLGGSMLVEKESRGLHANDEGYKMAITDALSTACKMLGVAANVYMGMMDGSKYDKKPEETAPKKEAPQAPTGPVKLTEPQRKRLWALTMQDKKLNKEEASDFSDWLKTKCEVIEIEGRKQLTKVAVGGLFDNDDKLFKELLFKFKDEFLVASL